MAPTIHHSSKPARPQNLIQEAVWNWESVQYTNCRSALPISDDDQDIEWIKVIDENGNENLEYVLFTMLEYQV